MGDLWLLDNSAWARSIRPGGLPHAVAEEFADALTRRQLGTCLPFRLEANYSARDARHFEWISRTLDRLPAFGLTTEAGERAASCQAQMSRIGHHRVPPVDLMIAAIADTEGIGVIHYDADYDLIREYSDLDFDSRWLAPRGSL